MSPSCRAPRTRRSGSSRQDGGNGQQRTRGKGRFQMLVSPASLTTWTGWQGIKVLRGLFQHCRDGMNGDQGQNTIHTAAGAYSGETWSQLKSQMAEQVTEKKMLKSPLKPRFLLCPHLRSGLNAMTHLKLETLAFSSPGAMYAMVSSMLGTWSRGQDALIPTGTSAGPAFSVSSKGKDSEVPGASLQLPSYCSLDSHWEEPHLSREYLPSGSKRT
ncbi:uncharacterized protein LOC120587867 isoform X4 [Pteropus medius]|uniref:uncharacterized protein LOC120587867 isoform X3 n=1 Tax=Pteropus vampyrus TaxID=132908 RepID=UPI00196B4F58|nr:uncharacterized protein LOC120587867 isoform X3 [Pteropus giganteus]XP_039700882.1 uncharacterized protein LOC120587867 isoform X4 [Pteropus giganteus]